MSRMDRVTLLEHQLANRDRMLHRISKMFSIHLNALYDYEPNEHCICDMGVCCDGCARCRADELARLRELVSSYMKTPGNGNIMIGQEKTENKGLYVDWMCRSSTPLPLPLP